MGNIPGKSTPASNNKQPDNQNTNSCTVSCPSQKNTRVECDVASLKVEDGASGRTIEISTSRVKEVLPKEAPPLIRIKLASYDAVLELLSSAQEHTGNSKNVVKKNASLKLVATRVGECPLKQHVALNIIPLNPLDAQDRHLLDGNISPAPVKVLGRPLATRRGPARWIDEFWSFGEEHVKQLVVSAESCGVLAAGKPNRALTCLVRVYRDDVYTLKFSMPAFKTFSREIKATVDRHGTLSRESSYEESRLGDKVRFEKHSSETNATKGIDFKSSKHGGVDQQGVLHSQSFGQGTKGNEFSMEHTATRTTQTGVPSIIRGGRTETYKVDTKGKETFVGKLEPQQIKPTLSLKRNDTELDFTKTANELLNLQSTLTKTLNDIQKWVPDIGLKLKVELSIMTGEISGSWGNRYPDAPKDTSKTPKDVERYKLVEEFFDIDFNLKVIDYSVTLSAGIDFKSPEIFKWVGAEFAAILKMAGKLSGNAAVTAKLTSLTKDKAVKIEGDSTLDIYVHGMVTVLSMTYEAKGGVKGGIKFSGALVGGFQVTPHIDGEFIFVQTIAYANFVDGTRERTKRFETVIFEKKEIWKGKLPSTV